MSCKILKLKNCEITGATYQGRKVNFLNRNISADTFTARVFDKEGFLLTEIVGLKSGSIVYFPFTALQTINKSYFLIKYNANLSGIGNVPFAEEELTISNNCSDCKPQDPITPYTLNIGSNVVNFHLEAVYIQIGQGGDVDLSAYLKKVDADNKYALKTHSHDFLEDVIEGANISIDKTNPKKPIISSLGGGVTKTSELTNDGEDGINPFITEVAVENKADIDASNIDLHIETWRAKVDANYVHDQASPKDIWEINHPLNKKVSVTVTDTAGTIVEGKVSINNGNRVVIEFNFPFSGEAILN